MEVLVQINEGKMKRNANDEETQILNERCHTHQVD